MRTITYCTFFLAAPLLAQSADRVKIDNDQVRVLKVVSKPGDKSGTHEHNMNRVMVYLDAGRMTLTGADGKVEPLQWKAGTVLWSPAPGQHVSTNTFEKPYQIVEIELKGTPQPARFPALDPVKVDPQRYKVEFENNEVRVVRARYGPREKGVTHEHALNRVVTFLTDQNMKITTPDGKANEGHARAGDVQWGGPAKHLEENLSDQPMEVVVVEFKTGGQR